MSKSLILDTSNLLYRCYHISRPDSETVKKWVSLLTEQKEEDLPLTEIIDEFQEPYIGAFFRALRSYVRDFEPDEIYAVWDKPLVRRSEFKNFRFQSVEYKANRDYSEKRLMHAFDKMVNDMIPALGIKILNPRVMEGDDVIAWLAHTLPGEKIIVSVDQDFLQLVNQSVAIYSPIKKVIITHLNVAEHTKVRPDCFILYKAILGDVGDNVPGLDGFGKLKAKKLAENWEQLVDKLTTEQKEMVNKCIQVVDLNQGYRFYPEEVISYQEQLQNQTNLKPDLKKFRELCNTNHMAEISGRFSEWVQPFRDDNPMVDQITALAKRLGLAT